MRPAVTRAVMQSIFWRSRKARLSDEWKCFQFINGNTKNLYQYWQRKKLLLAKPNIPEPECKQLLINTTKERNHVMSLGNCRLASMRRCVEAFNYIFHLLSSASDAGFECQPAVKDSRGATRSFGVQILRNDLENRFGSWPSIHHFPPKVFPLQSCCKTAMWATASQVSVFDHNSPKKEFRSRPQAGVINHRSSAVVKIEKDSRWKVKREV